MPIDTSFYERCIQTLEKIKTMLLRPKDRESLLRIFSSAGVPLEVWAYGSRVTGTAHSGSDLDLAVRSPDGQPLPRAVLNDLIEKIRESNIPILVDLRDWALLPESFRKNIERKHEVLFSNMDLLAS